MRLPSTQAVKRFGSSAILLAVLSVLVDAPVHAAERAKRAPRKAATPSVAPAADAPPVVAQPVAGQPPTALPDAVLADPPAAHGVDTGKGVGNGAVIPSATAPARASAAMPEAAAVAVTRPTLDAARAAAPADATPSAPLAAKTVAPADARSDAPDGSTALPVGAVPPDYRLGPEDVVDISVWRDDALKGSFLVRPDGYLSFPLAGEVLAEGRTAESVRADITARLKKYFSDPVVSVTVVRVAAQKIYVVGRVNKPGEFVSGRYIDVLQALSMAGGFSTFAKLDDIRVMRKEGGKQTLIPFKYNEVIKGRNLEQNITLRPGDVVVVP